MRSKFQETAGEGGGVGHAEGRGGAGNRDKVGTLRGLSAVRMEVCVYEWWLGE